jgi:hypothetical protein
MLNNTKRVGLSMLAVVSAGCEGDQGDDGEHAEADAFRVVGHDSSSLRTLGAAGKPGNGAAPTVTSAPHRCHVTTVTCDGWMTNRNMRNTIANRCFAGRSGRGRVGV